MKNWRTQCFSFLDRIVQIALHYKSDFQKSKEVATICVRDKYKKMTSFQKFISFMDKLKYNNRSVVVLLLINAILTVGSYIADWDWLLAVPRHFILFAPICSLYPLLLLIWFTAWKFGKKIPDWFTSFIFLGIFSYGIMSWIYFPLFMGWRGVNFHDVGSIFWVTAYGLQAFVIASELKRLPIYQYGLILSYFLFKDYADRYLGTFWDITLYPDYPEFLKTLFTTCIVLLHLIGFFLIVYLPHKNKHSAKMRYGEVIE